MKVQSKVFVIVTTLFILSPVLYVGIREMKYRASSHPEEQVKPATADTAKAAKVDTTRK